MKFKEAFDKVFDDHQKRQPEGVEFKVSRGTSIILAFLWSMLAVAKNVLDDKAYIDDNNNIVSIPLKESKEKEKTGPVDDEPTGEQKKQNKDKKQNGQKSKSTDDKKTVQEEKDAEKSVDTDNEQKKQKE